MTVIRFLIFVPLLGAMASAPAAEKEDAFGHALTLIQVLTRIAATSEDPLRALDEVLAGRNTEANRAAAGLFDEATAELPPEQRARVASIGQNLMILSRRSAGTDRVLQARKDLTAMGLRYHDSREFLDAVRRDDRLAVELFVQGGGVEPATPQALEIARAQGNRPMVELLAKNLPAAR